MSKSYTKDEVLENGYHQISVYDATSHALLSTYQTTPNGKKDGLEIIYTKDGIRCIENEYEKGSLRRCHDRSGHGILSAIKFLRNINMITEDDVKKMKKYIGKDDTPWDSAITTENGKYTHIYLRNTSIGASFDIEFKNEEPYNGRYFVHLESGGSFREGMFTGNKTISCKESPCKGFMPEKACFYQEFQDGELVSNQAIYWQHISLQGSSRWSRMKIPVNGLACKFRHGYEYKDEVLVEFQMRDGKRNGEYKDYEKNIKAIYKDDMLEGPYTEFFDKIDGKKKVEGFYKEGKKEGVWKYYAEDGTVINQEYWHKGKNCTKKYEILKKVASERIKTENELSEGKNERVVLPKMKVEEKQNAIKEAKKDLSK